MDIFPLWLKIPYTFLVFFIVPVYWKYWGPKNFLWISDFALFGLLVVVWFEAGMLASIIAVMAVAVEVAWAIDLLVKLLAGKFIFGLTRYMFSNEKSLFVRLLSLFHVPVLVLIIYSIHTFGYDDKALLYAAPIIAFLFTVTRIVKPEENINWVYGWSNKEWQRNKPLIYLPLLIILYVLLIMLPSHYLLKFLTDI